jgi:hypothetical protein
MDPGRAIDLSQGIRKLVPQEGPHVLDLDPIVLNWGSHPVVKDEPGGDLPIESISPFLVDDSDEDIIVVGDVSSVTLDETHHTTLVR